MNSWHHAQSAAAKWGGQPEDYLAIETFIDSSKQTIGDHRHRALYHHTLGVFLCQEIFGPVLEVGRKKIPVRLIAERHIIEDIGWLPSPQDYLEHMELRPFMSGAQRKTLPLSHILGEKDKQ